MPSPDFSHSSLAGINLHDIFAYIQTTDPGAVGAGANWLDTTDPAVPIWKRRNDADNGWITMMTAGAGASAVSSVNGQTGAVVLDSDDIAEGVTNLYYPSADATKLAGIEAGADVTDTAAVDAAGAVMTADTDTTGYAFVVDEDDFASNSATKLPTQQSVKSYVDANVGGGGLTDPTTTKGDLLVRGASALGRLGIGADGQVLTADSGQASGVKWAPASGGGGGTIFDGFIRASSAVYYSSQWCLVPASIVTGVVLPNSRSNAVAFRIPFSGTLDRLGVYVSGASTAGGVCRLSVFALDATTKRPGALLANTGEVAIDSVGAHEGVVALAVTAGDWIVLSYHGSQQATIIGWGSGLANQAPRGHDAITSGNDNEVAWIENRAYGLPPATFTVSGVASSVPRIFARITP